MSPREREVFERLVAFVDMHSEPWYRSGQRLLTEAREVLAQSKKRCPRCFGTKRELVVVNNKFTTIECRACGGSGEAR